MKCQPIDHHGKSAMVEQRSGVAVTEPISSVALFSDSFTIVKSHDRYWMSHQYLTGDAAAQLRWHLSNMNVIQRISKMFLQNSNFTYGEINEWSFSNPSYLPLTGKVGSVYFGYLGLIWSRPSMSRTVLRTSHIWQKMVTNIYRYSYSVWRRWNVPEQD